MRRAFLLLAVPLLVALPAGVAGAAVEDTTAPPSQLLPPTSPSGPPPTSSPVPTPSTPAPTPATEPTGEVSDPGPGSWVVLGGGAVVLVAGVGGAVALARRVRRTESDDDDDGDDREVADLPVLALHRDAGSGRPAPDGPAPDDLDRDAEVDRGTDVHPDGAGDSGQGNAAVPVAGAAANAVGGTPAGTGPAPRNGTTARPANTGGAAPRRVPARVGRAPQNGAPAPPASSGATASRGIPPARVGSAPRGNTKVVRNGTVTGGRTVRSRPAPWDVGGRPPVPAVEDQRREPTPARSPDDRPPTPEVVEPARPSVGPAQRPPAGLPRNKRKKQR